MKEALNQILYGIVAIGGYFKFLCPFESGRVIESGRVMVKITKYGHGM